MDGLNVDMLEIDNKNYLIVDNIFDRTSSTRYYYFVNENNLVDYIIEKLGSDNDSLLPVENREEFDRALGLFNAKYYG